MKALLQDAQTLSTPKQKTATIIAEGLVRPPTVQFIVGEKEKPKNPSLFKRLLRSRAFVCLLVIPNIISVGYLGLVASPIYVSTASVTIMSPSQNASSLTSLLSGSSADGSTQGAYILSEYVGSWQAFRNANNAVSLAEHYRQGDLGGRYGGLWSLMAENDVALWQYFQQNVKVSVDAKSGIALLQVYGYRPEFALHLAKLLLDDAVRHMNDMNQRQESEFINNAETRKSSLQQAVERDEAAIAAYRGEVGIFDPKEVYLSRLSLVNSLTMRLTELRSQYEAIIKATPDNPQARNLTFAMAAVQEKINSTQETFASISRAAARYGNLITSRENNVSLLQQANAAVQQAHQKAMQSRYYLQIISEPSLPQTPELPRRLQWIVGIFLFTFVLWGLLR